MNAVQKLILANLLLCGLAAVSCAQSYPPAWNSAASYAVGDQVQLNGNVLRAVRAVSPGGFKYAYWELWDVRANTTLLVGTGAPFQTLTSAWTYALNCKVAQGVYLHIVLLSGHVESIAGPFSLDQSSGARVSIIGDGPTVPVITFTNTGVGFLLDSGHALGRLQGLTINGPNGGTNMSPAIEVEEGSVLAGVTDLTVNNFDLGFQADTGSTIDNVSGISLNQFSLGGAKANSNATIVFSGPVTFDGANTTTTVPQFGYFTTGGTIWCQFCTANNCIQDFVADRSGTIFADDTFATSPITSAYLTGYYVYDSGRIYANRSLATGSEEGYFATTGGYIGAESSQAKGYSDHGYDANLGGIIDENNSSGGTRITGSGDGSYIY